MIQHGDQVLLLVDYWHEPSFPKPGDILNYEECNGYVGVLEKGHDGFFINPSDVDQFCIKINFTTFQDVSKG